MKSDAVFARARREIRSALACWDPHRGPATWPGDELVRLARPIVAHHARTIPAYARLCASRGFDPQRFSDWRAIPAVPVDAFKRARISCAEGEAALFRTSGTTGDARGEHVMGSTETYTASILGPFRRHVIDSKRSAPRLVMLAPPPEDLPDSSLSFMFGVLRDKLGARSSSFHVGASVAGELDYDTAGAARALDALCVERDPILVLGTAFALVHLFDDQASARWRLPEGSRVMETGGFKGRSRSVDRADLYAAIQERFAIAPEACVSEYSMTELSSQAYGRALGGLETPPWAAIELVDPRTLAPLERRPGQVGLIRWFDLANVWSTLAVQTSDQGRVRDDTTIELLGRAPEAELRGCSQTIEEIT